MLRLYNTLIRKIEDFVPIDPPNVGYYSCGPTVYDYAHIGHARTYVFADILQRVLEMNGYQVKRVMNITDVGHLTSDSDTGEDKMEKGAKREGRSVWQIADFYTQDFFQMIDKLNLKKPQIICKATDSISSMIRIIELLEKKGYTYKIADGVYFDTSKFANYGTLTGQKFSQLQKSLKAGARVEMVTGKKNITDFALWKFSYPGGRSFDAAQDDAAQRRQMEWDSPWGRGFPGWHIECSAMSMKYLGSSIDIHTGGTDHIAIHHTNEIAQSEAATGKKFVNFWLHGEHLLVDGQKMSKSLGNFYRLADLEEKRFNALDLKYLFLTAHYRTQMNFTYQSLESAKISRQSLLAYLFDIKDKSEVRKRVSLSEEKLLKRELYRNKFMEALNDDLNTAAGLSLVWETVKSNIPAEDKLDLIFFFDEVLGLNFKLELEKPVQKIPVEVEDLAGKREALRKQKRFTQADKIRQIIEEKGYFIEDTSSGYKIRIRQEYES